MDSQAEDVTLDFTGTDGSRSSIGTETRGQISGMSIPSHAMPRSRRRLFSVRLRSLLLLVPLCALIALVWKFYQDYGDLDRAELTGALHSFAAAKPAEKASLAGWLAAVKGPEMRRIFPALLVATNDPDPIVRASAARAVGQLISGNAQPLHGELADEVAVAGAQLIACFQDKDPRVRAEAVKALGSINIPQVSLRPPVGGKTGYGPLSPDRRAVLAVLHRAIRDSDANVRATACSTLGVYADAREDAPAELIAALEDPDVDKVRGAAAGALGDSPWKNQSALITPLVKAFLVTPQRNRPQAPYVKDHYFTHWDPPRGQVGRERIASALVAISQKAAAPPEAAPWLLLCLEMKDGPDPLAIVRLLLSTGSEGRTAVPILVRIAKQQAAQECERWAIDCLPPFDPTPSQTQELTAELATMALNQFREGKYISAANSLFKLAPDSPEAAALVAPLAKLARSQIAAGQQLTAVKVLFEYKSKVPEAVDLAVPLAKMLLSDHEERGRADRRIEALSGDVESSQYNAASSDLVRIDERNSTAAKALSTLGPRASAAVPFLLKLRDAVRQDFYPRTSVDEILQTIN
jgi:hypothetical protein